MVKIGDGAVDLSAYKLTQQQKTDLKGAKSADEVVQAIAKGGISGDEQKLLDEITAEIATSKDGTVKFTEGDFDVQGILFDKKTNLKHEVNTSATIQKLASVSKEDRTHILSEGHVTLSSDEQKTLFSLLDKASEHGIQSLSKEDLGAIEQMVDKIVSHLDGEPPRTEEHVETHGTEEHSETHGTEEHGETHGTEEHTETHGTEEHGETHSDTHGETHGAEQHGETHGGEHHEVSPTEKAIGNYLGLIGNNDRSGNLQAVAKNLDKMMTSHDPIEQAKCLAIAVARFNQLLAENPQLGSKSLLAMLKTDKTIGPVMTKLQGAIGKVPGGSVFKKLFAEGLKSEILWGHIGNLLSPNTDKQGQTSTKEMMKDVRAVFELARAFNTELGELKSMLPPKFQKALTSLEWMPPKLREGLMEHFKILGDKSPYVHGMMCILAGSGKPPYADEIGGSLMIFAQGMKDLSNSKLADALGLKKTCESFFKALEPMGFVMDDVMTGHINHLLHASSPGELASVLTQIGDHATHMSHQSVNILEHEAHNLKHQIEHTEKELHEVKEKYKSKKLEADWPKSQAELKHAEAEKLRKAGKPEEALKLENEAAELEKTATKYEREAALLENEATRLETKIPKMELEHAQKEIEIAKTEIGLKELELKDAKAKGLTDKATKLEEEIAGLEKEVKHLTHEAEKIETKLAGTETKVVTVATEELTGQMAKRSEEITAFAAKMGLDKEAEAALRKVLSNPEFDEVAFKEALKVVEELGVKGLKEGKVVSEALGPTLKLLEHLSPDLAKKALTSPEVGVKVLEEIPKLVKIAEKMGVKLAEYVPKLAKVLGEGLRKIIPGVGMAVAVWDTARMTDCAARLHYNGTNFQNILDVAGTIRGNKEAEDLFTQLKANPGLAKEATFAAKLKAFPALTEFAAQLKAKPEKAKELCELAEKIKTTPALEKKYKDLQALAMIGAMVNGADVALSALEFLGDAVSGVGGHAVGLLPQLALAGVEVTIDLLLEHYLEHPEDLSDNVGLGISAAALAMNPAGALGIYGPDGVIDIQSKLVDKLGHAGLTVVDKATEFHAQVIDKEMELASIGMHGMADMIRNPEKYAAQLGVAVAEVGQLAANWMAKQAAKGVAVAQEVYGVLADIASNPGKYGKMALDFAVDTGIKIGKTVVHAAEAAGKFISDMATKGVIAVKEGFNALCDMGEKGLVAAQHFIEDTLKTGGKIAQEALIFIADVASHPGESALAAGKALVNAVKAGGTMALEGLKTLKDMAVKGYDWAAEGIQSVVAAGGKMATAALNYLSELPEKAAKLVGEGLDAAMKAGKATFGMMQWVAMHPDEAVKKLGEKGKELLLNTADWLVDRAKDLKTGIEDTMAALENLCTKGGSYMSDLASRTGRAVVDFGKTVGNLLKDGVDVGAKVITRYWNVLEKRLPELLNAMADLAQAPVDLMVRLGKMSVEAGLKVAEKLADKAVELGSKAIQGLQQLGNAGVKALEELAVAGGKMARQAMDGLKAMGTQAIDALKEMAIAGGHMAQEAFNALKTQGKAAINALKEVGMKVEAFAKPAIDALKSVGVAAEQALLELGKSLKAHATEAMDALKSLGQNAYDSVKALADKYPDLKGYAIRALSNLQGAAQYVDAMVTDLWKSGKAGFETLMSVASDIGSVASKVASLVTSKLSEGWEKSTVDLGHIAVWNDTVDLTPLTQAIGELTSMAVGAGAEALAQLKAMIAQSLKDLGVPDSVVNTVL